jgi:hypothetical protein
LRDGNRERWIPHMTVLIVDRKTNEKSTTMFVLDIPFCEGDEKHKAMFGLGRKMYADGEGPLAVVFSSEAWTSPDVKGVEPRHHPERKEVVHVIGMAPIGNGRPGMTTKAAVMPLVRQGGKIVAGALERAQGESRSFLLEDFYQGFMAGRLAEVN